MTDIFSLLPLIFILAVIWFLYRRLTKLNKYQPVKQVKSISDDEEEDIYFRESHAVSETVPVQAKLILHYKDASDISTKRLVDIREADIGWKQGYLSGLCHLRNAYRTFRIDRIQRSIIPETGELVPDIQAYLRGVYKASPAFSVNRLLHDACDVIRALIYIGKSDGRLTMKEKGVMLSFCQDAAKDQRLSMDDLNKIIDYYAIPTKHSFRMICGRISKLPLPLQRQAIDMAIAMVGTETTVDMQETEALEYLSKRLSIPLLTQQ